MGEDPSSSSSYILIGTEGKEVHSSIGFTGMESYSTTFIGSSEEGILAGADSSAVSGSSCDGNFFTTDGTKFLGGFGFHGVLFFRLIGA